jgi:hypothetical protein
MVTAINLLAILVSSLALITSIAALALTIGMKLSTHQIQFKDVETPDFDKFEEEEEKKIEEDSDELLEKALNLQRKKKKIEDPLDAIAETSNF